MRRWWWGFQAAQTACACLTAWRAWDMQRMRPILITSCGQNRGKIAKWCEGGAGLGLPYIFGSADVGAAARAARLSIEEAARNLRYRFLFDTARALGAQAVAVGHNADDQVETVLMHLLRGSGLAGLTGMDFRALLPVFDTELPVVRPLLAAWRTDILAYCQERGLPYVNDASNQNRAFFRNRLRHELLPELASYNPQIKTVMWRMAQVLAGDEQLLAQAEQAAWEQCLEIAQPHAIIFILARLRDCPLPMQRRLLRRAVGLLRPALRDVDFDAVQRATDFVGSPARSGRSDLLQGLELQVEPGPRGERLLLVDRLQGAVLPEADWPQMEGEEQPLPLPGELHISPGWLLRAEVLLANSALPFTSSAWEAWLDADLAGPHLFVRRARPGDRFQPLGMQGSSMKLSDFWINCKLPRRARAGWPLVCSGEQVAWVPGFRVAHPFRVTASTRQVIHLAVWNSVIQTTG
jgi:tRNA(Ile)-lysidine synthase